jgi:hypothetical protein
MCFLGTNVELLKFVKVQLITENESCFLNSGLNISMEGSFYIFFQSCSQCPVHWWVQLSRCLMQNWIMNCFIKTKISAFWGNVKVFLFLATSLKISLAKVLYFHYYAICQGHSPLLANILCLSNLWNKNMEID